MQEQINRHELRFLLRKTLERLAHDHHHHASREAEACFNEIVGRQSERTTLLCGCAARLLDDFAQNRVGLVKEQRDLGPFQADLISYAWGLPTPSVASLPFQTELISYGWGWPTPLKLANLDESEKESLDLTLKARIMYWDRKAFAKATNSAGSSVVPQPTEAPGGTESVAIKKGRKHGPEEDIDGARGVATLQEAGEGNADHLSTRQDRQKAVEAYRNEVFSRTGKRITKTTIWKTAGYKSRTEFERWHRNDTKNPNKTAHERFTRILTEKPRLK